MIEQPSSLPLAPIERSPASAFFPWLGQAARILLLWAARSRQRHDLALLDEARLRDIGLTLDDVQAEIAKPFWQK